VYPQNQLISIEAIGNTEKLCTWILLVLYFGKQKLVGEKDEAGSQANYFRESLELAGLGDIFFLPRSANLGSEPSTAKVESQ